MIERLDEILSGRRVPGVYRWDRAPAGQAHGASARGTSLPGTDEIRERAESQGWRCFHLDGRRISSKAEFLHACARAMRFPGHFGQNWDALEESLRDLDWAPATGGYLVVYDWGGRFERSSPQEFATAVAILRSAVSYWAATPTPMTVLIGGLVQAHAEIPGL